MGNRVRTDAAVLVVVFRDADADGALRDLDAEQVGVSVYVATRFRFGQARGNTPTPDARVVVEAWALDDDERTERFSVSASEALRLVHILVRLADAHQVRRRVAVRASRVAVARVSCAAGDANWRYESRVARVNSLSYARESA